MFALRAAEFIDFTTTKFDGVLTGRDVVLDARSAATRSRGPTAC
jgi:hypothetical protein